MKKLLFLLFAILVVFVCAFVIVKEVKAPTEPQKLTTITLALDYTPNTNHTGIYTAIANGWYKQEGLNVKILPYSSSISPDLLVSAGKADVGISYTEGVVTDAATGAPVVSIAAIIQHNTSSLVALANSGIKTPKDLNGKVYGGFGAPFENAVVSQIIKTAGGKGEFKNVTLDVGWDKAMVAKKIDFAWIYEGWEGVMAKRNGIDLIHFPLTTSGIPDYYTPVFITSSKEIKEKSQLLTKFMKATAKGYEYAIQNPVASANLLINGAPKGTFQDKEFVIESQKYLSSHYVEKGRKWGLQDESAWTNYPEFMLKNNAVLDANGKVVKTLDTNSLFTNKFIE